MANFDSEKLKAKTAEAVRTAKNLVWEVRAAPDRTFEFARQDIEQNKLMSMLSYVHFLVLVPLLLPRFTGKNSPYMQFHARQGLVLFIIEVLASLILSLLGHIPLIGFIFSLAKILIYIACALLSAKNIWDILNGKAIKLPFVDSLIAKFLKR